MPTSCIAAPKSRRTLLILITALAVTCLAPAATLRAEPLVWETSKANAMALAKAQGKLVLMVAGRAACSNTTYMRNTVCESTSPAIKQQILDRFVPWYADVDIPEEWKDWYGYASGLGYFTLPLICIIAPSQPDSYLDRTTSVQLANAFFARLQDYPTISLTPKVRRASGSEATTPAVIGVSLSAASSRTVTVRYATANGTAAAGSDYTATSGTLTFDPGVTNQSINVPVVGDTAVEANETFKVTLTNHVNATLGAVSRLTYTITNDDFHGSIALNSATYAVGEAGSSVTITATRTGGSSGAVGVSYATANGTATAGRDYATATGKLSWADGDTADQTFTVPITDDPLDEPDETFTVTLFSPTGRATLGSPSRGTVTISDDDPTPTVQFSFAASSGAESTTPARINVELSAASGRTVKVKYATAAGTEVSGSNYTARSGILKFTPGMTSRTITVPILNNTAIEASESFTVSLTTPVNATLGATSTHTYTIEDEDAFGAIQLSSARYSVGEARSTVTITAQRIGGAGGAVGVSFATADGTATAGSDYPPVSDTLSWAAGDRANKIFTVPIAEDALDEANETFTVTLTSPTGGAILGSTDTGTVTITDNDLPPKVRFSLAASSGVESSTPVQISVVLSAASDRTVTVKYATANGSARSGSDYAASSGTLSFSPGETSGTIDVPIVDDAAVEPNQTFAVRLMTPVHATLGAPYKHVYTIMDDDVVELDQLDADPYPLDISMSTAVITVNDFDGDGRSDCGVFDAASGNWSLRLSTDGDLTDQLGSAGSVPVTGDFDGDGRGDYGVFDPASGLWSLRLSTDGDLADQLGSAGSVPVTGDFDGDGRSDYGVYDTVHGLWHLRQSTNGAVTDQLGSAGSVPVTGDFDGDGRSDYGVYDPDAGLWSLRLSTQGAVTVHFGSAGAVPVTGDFDGDGASDYGCYTPTTGWWEIALSSGGLRTERLGDPGAIPIVGDFDGDGVTDIGSYSPATPGEDGVRLASPGSWQIIQSTGGWRTETFGDAGALPIGGTTR